MFLRNNFLIIIFTLFLSSCSTQQEQFMCNAVEGSQGSSGMFDKTVNGTISAILKDPNYDCVKKDKNMCIDSKGKIKENCTLTN